MNFVNLFLVVVWILIAALAALNWDALAAIHSVSLGISTVHLPLGAALLGPVLLVTGLYGATVAGLRTAAHIQARRHVREMQASRALADDAEASRLTALRAFLETEFARHASERAALRTEVITRIETSEQDLRSSIEQAGNTLAAYIGELEDRLGNTNGH